MNPRRYPLLCEALSLLEERGATDVSHKVGGKHLRVSFVYHGVRAVATVPLSPSDWRSGHNNLSQIRRTLRQIDEKRAGPFEPVHGATK